MVKNCLIVAGEKSGEDHALSFYSKIKQMDPHIQFFGVGGDELLKSGMELIFRLKEFSTWGISELIGKIPFYKMALEKLEEEVVKRNCQTAILVDFQGFNLRLARRLKQRGVKVLYYVAPQAWVWKPGRTNILKSNVHCLYTILPFEKEWFADRGVNCLRVSHPLLKSFAKGVKQKSLKSPAKSYFNILLLPGSRNAEVKYLLPEFLSASHILKKKFCLKVSLVRSPNVNPSLYQSLGSDIKIYESIQLQEALLESDMALAASGTVTLAAALLGVPTVVGYKLSLLNEFIFETFISYRGPYALPNIILNKTVFPELLQERATGYNMAMELQRLITDQSLYEQRKRDLFLLESYLRMEDVDPATHMLGVING